MNFLKKLKNLWREARLEKAQAALKRISLLKREVPLSGSGSLLLANNRADVQDGKPVRLMWVTQMKHADKAIVALQKVYHHVDLHYASGEWAMLVTEGTFHEEGFVKSLEMAVAE